MTSLCESTTPPPAKLTVIVFGTLSEAARLLAKAAGARYVDRLTSDLDELRLVAHHRVVEPTVIVVLRGDKLVARIPRLLDLDTLRADLHRLGA